jgi:flagellar biosynthesis/type III secretory pathway protein FliH
MEPLIRSPTLGISRIRLSASLNDRQRRDQEEKASPVDQLRAEVEQSVRTEILKEIEALHERERVRAEAEGYADGLAQGHAAAHAQATQDRAESRADINHALAAMQQAHRETLDRLEKGIGELTFAAICQLIGQHAASRVFRLGVIEQLCTSIRSGEIASLRLHPREIESLKGLADADALPAVVAGVRMIPDELLELGGYVVESSVGEFCGSLESQLRKLHAVLTETLVDGEG